MVAAAWSRPFVALSAILGLAVIGVACGDDGDSAGKKAATVTTTLGSEAPPVTVVPGGPATIDQDLSGLDDELGAIDEELSDLDQGVAAQ